VYHLFRIIGLFLLFGNFIAYSQTADVLSIKDAVAIALKNNPHVLAAQKQISAERGRFWRGISPPAPSLSVNYEYIPKSSSINRFGEKTVEISQSLDFPTNILLHGSQLSSQIAIAEAEYAATSVAITAEVKIAYYNLLAKQKKLELAKENLEIAEDFASKAEIRYNVGEGTNLERLTANVQRSQARNAIQVAENDRKIAFGELFYILGTSKEEQTNVITLTDSLAYKPIMLSLEQLLESAFAVNSNLKAASEKVSASSIGRALAWSSILPSLSASYYRQTVNGNPDFYGVSFGISIPLWFLFDQRGQIQEASANLSIADADLQSIRNFVCVDVKNAFLEMTNNRRQVEIHQTDILPQAEETYRTALESYKAGDITYIEFLQARQILISSRDEYIEVLSHYNISLTKLEQAVGSSIVE
jgi:outer membrane protein, heavy metal efflux system